jgi:AraC-like DNA-binding protein
VELVQPGAQAVTPASSFADAGTFLVPERADHGASCPATAPALRALALMVQSEDESLSVARLAHQSGLSTRTLHRVVRRHFGLSPMALFRRIRRLKVRAELQAPRSETTVTAVALRWGFTHLGRFAGEYAREFGERPSATLRRARQRRAPDRLLA